MSFTLHAQDYFPKNDGVKQSFKNFTAIQNATIYLSATQKIENATPSTLKAMGIAKLPFLLLLIGNQVKKIITPALKNLIDTYIKKFLDADACPERKVIDKFAPDDFKAPNDLPCAQLEQAKANRKRPGL